MFFILSYLFFCNESPLKVDLNKAELISPASLSPVNKSLEIRHAWMKHGQRNEEKQRKPLQTFKSRLPGLKNPKRRFVLYLFQDASIFYKLVVCLFFFVFFSNAYNAMCLNLPNLYTLVCMCACVCVGACVCVCAYRCG